MKTIAFYGSDIRNLAGTERAMFSVANGLAQDGNYKVIIISTIGTRKDIKYELDPKVKIICLNILNAKRQYLQLTWRLNKCIISEKISYFISVESISVIFTLPSFFTSRMVRNVKFIVWEHFNFSVDLGKKLRITARQLARRFANGIVVLTDTDLQLWQKERKPKAKMVAINNPSPFPVNHMEYNVNSKIFIAIGRLTYQKGFDRLVKIWKKFLDVNPLTDWKLMIIGSGPDEQKLKELAMELNIPDSLVWVSNTPHIKSFYENAAALLMTSRFEGLPMTLIEAQSYGLPIIAYDCLTGPAEVVTKNSGILVEDDNEIEFVRALQTISNNTELRLNMSKSAKHEVLRFDPKLIAEKWLSFVKNF